MKPKYGTFLIVLSMLIWFPARGEIPAPLVGHRLSVTLADGALRVEDRLQLPERLPKDAELRLNKGFVLQMPEGLTPLGVSGDDQRLGVAPELAGKTLVLRYSGRPQGIDAPTRLGDMPRGVLDAQGVFLDGASGWYPWLPGSLQRFDLRVVAPSEWRVLSQGRGGREGEAWHWREAHPQQDIYLLAGPYHIHRRVSGEVALEVWLLADDAALAQRYLEAGAEYLGFYSRLIDAYPYAKFAVVENRWQTGYGMPSFTLLGSRVMRLPFILHSSLPHEILHNWWGNGVYVDYRQGNWSEGLTAYLSDYLLRERKGEGAAYRRRALERFTNFAADGRDFPLSRFVSRHGESSQAVGYDKSLMLFHQIRRRLGDPAFFRALRDFYRQWRFRRAAFDDLIAAFEQAAGASLQDLVMPLLHGVGAPRLSLEKAALKRQGEGWALHLRLRRTPAGDGHPLAVPLLIGFDDAPDEERRVMLDDTLTEVTLRFPRRPSSVALDPDHQLFRLLDPSEKPSALGRLFGAPRQLLVLPSASADLPAWRELARRWQRRYHNVETLPDDRLEQLPADRATWVLGWDNRFAAAALRRVGGAAVDRTRRALVRLDADNLATPFGFIGAQGADVIAALARKLPHYGSYGELEFALPAVRNRLKRRLPVRRSALRKALSGEER